jgi:putative tricarboxylic transport membrane protein
MLRALKMSDGDPMVLFSSSLGNMLWAALVITLILPAFFKRRRQSKAAE